MKPRASSDRLSRLLSSSTAGGRLGPELAALPDLEQHLERLLSAARAAWPGIDVDDAVYLERLAAHLASECDARAALGSVHASDLYLAVACTAGNPKALSALERCQISQVPRALSRLSPTADFVEEVKQQLRDRLLVREARAKVLKWTQLELARMGLVRAELESIVRGVSGQLDVSLQRVLGEPEGDDE